MKVTDRQSRQYLLSPVRKFESKLNINNAVQMLSNLTARSFSISDTRRSHL